MSRMYRQWVDQYQDEAWTLARYLLKDASEAEDATQDAFIKLWKHRDNVDPERVFLFGHSMGGLQIALSRTWPSPLRPPV